MGLFGRRDDAEYIRNMSERLDLHRLGPIEGYLDPELRRGTLALDMTTPPPILRHGFSGWYGKDNDGLIRDALIRYKINDGCGRGVPLPPGVAMAQPVRAKARRGWNSIVVNIWEWVIVDTKTGLRYNVPWDDVGRQIAIIRRISGNAEFASDFKPEPAAVPVAPKDYVPVAGKQLRQGFIPPILAYVISPPCFAYSICRRVLNPVSLSEVGQMYPSGDVRRVVPLPRQPDAAAP